MNDTDMTPQGSSSAAPRIPRVLAFVGSLVGRGANAAVLVVMSVWRRLDDWLSSSKKSLYGLSVTRILFGVTAMGLLIANWRTRYYSFGSGSAWNGEMVDSPSDFPRIWLFSAFHTASSNDVAYTALYVLLFVLAVLFVLGWRFRLVLPAFFFLWVGFIEANDMLGDQGDNMFRIAMILMFFADPAARWSLDARRRRRKGEWFADESGPRQIGIVAHNLALVALAAQVIFVYTSGALFKAGGSPWREGWAVYHPLSTARFGTWPVLSELVTTWGPAVAVMTLGSVFLQAAFPFMLLTRPTRLIALVGILSFHVGIAVLMGLPWFSLTMIAIDAIFIRDRSWARIGRTWRETWQSTRVERHDPPRNSTTERSEIRSTDESEPLRLEAEFRPDTSAPLEPAKA